MPRCPQCHDDFFWPTPSHSCVFTAHGKVVVGGQLVGNLPCLDQTVPPPPDCRVCPPWIKCVQCSATFRGKVELKAHTEIDHPVKRNTVPSTQSGQPQTEAREKDFERKVRGPYNKSKIRVNQIKVPTTWQVLPSKPLKRSAENILFNFIQNFELHKYFLVILEFCCFLLCWPQKFFIKLKFNTENVEIVIFGQKSWNLP